MCVCADTGGTREFGDEEEEEGSDNSFSEQLAEVASSVALEGSR